MAHRSAGRTLTHASIPHKMIVARCPRQASAPGGGREMQVAADDNGVRRDSRHRARDVGEKPDTAATRAAHLEIGRRIARLRRIMQAQDEGWRRQRAAHFARQRGHAVLAEKVRRQQDRAKEPPSRDPPARPDERRLVCVTHRRPDRVPREHPSRPRLASRAHRGRLRRLIEDPKQAASDSHGLVRHGKPTPDVFDLCPSTAPGDDDRNGCCQRLGDAHPEALRVGALHQRATAGQEGPGRLGAHLPEPARLRATGANNDSTCAR